MRGKPLISHLGKHAKRITPADAGKTVCTTTHTPVQWDHPRRCGENKTTLRQCSYRLRITPAGAGKTRENRRNPAQAAGSPPQVRGKLTFAKNALGRFGITPAGAGKTRISCLRILLQKDHPRRCGENMIPPCRLCVNTGSPPQVRGKRWKMGPEITGRRITPAGAGKTDFYKIRQKTFKDHPRRCGENTLRAALYEFPPGSPPQVRGKPFRNDNFRFMLRITPAGAGKTETYTFCGIEI